MPGWLTTLRGLLASHVRAAVEAREWLTRTTGPARRTPVGGVLDGPDSLRHDMAIRCAEPAPSPPPAPFPPDCSSCRRATADADLDDHRRRELGPHRSHMLQRRRCGEDRRPERSAEGPRRLGRPGRHRALGVDPKIADNGWTILMNVSATDASKKTYGRSPAACFQHPVRGRRQRS